MSYRKRWTWTALVLASLGAASLATALGAGAAPGVAKNLIVNGNAERGDAVNDASSMSNDIPGWTRTGKFTLVEYGASGGFPDATVQTAVKGGKSFFAGGPANPGSAISQEIRVASLAKLIDSGKARATLSGYIGGYASQNDSLVATATFLSAAGAKLGAVKIGPVSAAARKSVTGMLPKTASAVVPRKTRTIRVALGANRNDGSYNDGYADNLVLTLGR